MVYDHYQDKPLTESDVKRLTKQFYDVIYDDIKAAEKLDKHLEQPDCEDPEKAKLLERIKELESQLAKRKTRKRSKK